MDSRVVAPCRHTCGTPARVPGERRPERPTGRAAAEVQTDMNTPVG